MPQNETPNRPEAPPRTVAHRLKDLRWHLGLVAFVLFSLPLALLPTPVAVGFGGAAGRLAFLLLGRVRRTAVENIRASLPHLRTLPEWRESHGSPEEIARRSFVNLGKTAMEVIKLLYGFDRRLTGDIHWEGLEQYRQAKERGKGVILITGHFDNWELVAYAFGIHHDGMAVVARQQKYQPLTALLEKVRTRHGKGVVYAEGAARGIYTRLKKNEAIAIVMDQAVKPRDGAIVEFLGRGAWTTTMPAFIAARTGAALVPCFSHREGKSHVVTFHPAIPPQENGDPVATTRLLNHCIEQQIARYPDQWLWAYRRWKGVPEAPPGSGQESPTAGTPPAAA